MKTWIAVASLILAGSALAAEPVYPYPGSRTLVKTKHLHPALKGGEGYGDKYTFNADFGERGSFYFSITVSNLGMGDHKLEAKGRLSLDGEKFKWKKQLDKGDWKWGKAPFHITAGPAKISGTPKNLVFDVSKGGKTLHLEFTPIANAWRPRGGQIHYGKDRKATDYTVFPLMNVKGKANIGKGDVEVSGHGFGTHTWSELAVYEQARWTMEARGISGDTTIYLREIGTATEFGAQRIPYLIVTQGKKLVAESFDYTLKPTALLTDTKHDNKYRVPESFTIQGRDSEDKAVQFRGKFTKKKLRKRKDLLKSMNAALRMVAGQYSQPVSYEYDTDFTVQVKTASGVVEVKGLARYEVTHWNK